MTPRSVNRLIAFTMCVLLASAAVQAQSFRKYPVQQSGCHFYNYCDPSWKVSFSEDSAKILQGECVTEGFHYGIICVKLNEDLELDIAERLMEKYMDLLKSAFDVKQAVGYGRGHRLLNSEKTRGVLDYWKDQDGDNWKVKGWTNGLYLGILMVYGSGEIPESKANLFLDGFRFPE